MKDDDTSPLNREDVIELLSGALAADAAALDHLDALAKNSTAAFDQVNLLFSDPRIASAIPGLGRLKKLLKQLKADARKARKIVDEANESFDRARQSLEALEASRASAQPVARFTLYSVRIDPPADGRTAPLVYLNGVRYPFPVKIAETLAALARDDGASEDRYVAFKSRVALKRELGVKSGNLSNRIYRLREHLTENLKLPRGLVETDFDTSSYRLRIPHDEQD